MKTKRTILISGASSGIGLATTQQRLDEGHRVIGIARDFTKCGIDNARFTAIKLDMGDIKNLSPELETLNKKFPEIDVLINCAGQGHFGSLEEFSYKQIYKSIDLNFTSHAFVCRAFMPSLRKKPHSNIIFMGSEAALEGTQKGSVYCASKFALRGFAQALRAECASSGVHISIVNPGMVKTAFFDELNFAPGDEPDNHITAADVATVIGDILNMRPGTVIDEINLSPLKKVINFKKK